MKVRVRGFVTVRVVPSTPLRHYHVISYSKAELINLSVPTIALTQTSLQLRVVSAVPCLLDVEKKKTRPSRQMSNPLVLVSFSLSLLSLCSQF